jgi:hypothetical protein
VDVIHVSARRLDLHKLEDGERITILTGSNGIQVITGGAGDVHLGFAAVSRGPLFIGDGLHPNRWLNLEALQPLKLYHLQALRADGDGVEFELRDNTPDIPAAGGQGWGSLGLLLNGGRP